mgnify:CR=1 FL=1
MFFFNNFDNNDDDNDNDDVKRKNLINYARSGVRVIKRLKKKPVASSSFNYLFMTSR